MKASDLLGRQQWKKLLPIETEEPHYEITWSFQVLVLSYVTFQPYMFALECMDMIPDI